MHLLHFKRTLHLETIPIARALLKCSCIRGVEKSRGGDGTAWKATDMLGKLSRALTRKLTHQISSTLYKGKRIVFIESPQRAAHTGWSQLSVSSSWKAKGSHGSRGINTCYLLLASDAAPPGAPTEGAQPPGTCLILVQVQLGGGFPFWSGMNAGVICMYYLYSVSHFSLILLYAACFPSISVKQCITLKKPTGWTLFLGSAAPNISNTVSYIHL